MLTTALGQCIRFAATDVRVFKGRGSTGVRGVNLAAGDRVISMAVIRHFEASAAERNAYLKMSRAVRGEADDVVAEIEPDEQAAETSGDSELSQERYAGMGASEEFLLTVSENGYGKRTSSFEYRLTGRGGKGIVAMVVNERNGKLVASFPVDEADEIMLVSNSGQVIRTPVETIRIVGRASQGVTIFSPPADDKVVSVEHVEEPDEPIEDDTTAPPSA
jgi:DNA gyrase subunit A